MFPRTALAAAAGALTAFAAVPGVRRLALRLGALDRPGARRIHDRPVPRLGGLAIYLGFLTGTALAGDLAAPGMKGLLAGSAVTVLIGVSDDIRPLRPAGKLLGQLLAAAAAMAGGVRITVLTVPGGTAVLSGFWSAAATALWLAGLSNAMNLMDGLDGLAAGLTAVGCAGMLAAGMLTPGGDGAAAVLAALGGACLGFLPWNRHPARIFMGDAGSLLLGFVPAAVSAAGLFKAGAAVAFAVPLLIWALPIADTAWAFLRRVRRGRSPFAADRRHIHHRLLAAGLTQPQATRVLCAVGAAAALAAAALLAETALRPGLTGLSGLTAAAAWRAFFRISRNRRSGEAG